MKKKAKYFIFFLGLLGALYLVSSKVQEKDTISKLKPSNKVEDRPPKEESSNQVPTLENSKELIDIAILSPCEAFFAVNFKDKLQDSRDERSNTLYYYNNLIKYRTESIETKDIYKFESEIHERLSYYEMYPSLADNLSREITIIQNSEFSEEIKEKGMYDLKMKLEDSTFLYFPILIGSAKTSFIQDKSSDRAIEDFKLILNRLNLDTAEYLIDYFIKPKYFILESAKNDLDMAIALKFLEEFDKPDILWFQEMEEFLDESELSDLQGIYLQIVKYYNHQPSAIMIDFDVYEMAYNGLKEEDKTESVLTPENLMSAKTSIDREFYEKSGCDERYIKTLCDKYCK